MIGDREIGLEGIDGLVIVEEAGTGPGVVGGTLETDNELVWVEGTDIADRHLRASASASSDESSLESEPSA